MEKGLTFNMAPRLTKKLAQLNIQRYNYKRAEELLVLNIGNESYRYEPRLDLLKLYESVNDYKRINLLYEEIYKLGIKIPSKKIDTYKAMAKSVLREPYKFQNNIKGTLSENNTIFSKILGRKNNYRIYLPNIKHITSKLPVVYVSDGQNYSKSNVFLEEVDKLIEDGKIRPLAIVFVDPRDIKDVKKIIDKSIFYVTKNMLTFLLMNFYLQ